MAVSVVRRHHGRVAIEGTTLEPCEGRAEIDQAIDEVRAYGPRLAYSALPDEVREWVDATIGSPVVGAQNQIGGFSPGVAARVRTAHGARAFVKAVGVVLNPETPALLRAEIEVLQALGPSPLRPTLLASYDDGDWVALVLEDIEGQCPALPWRAGDLARVGEALEQLAATHTPSPWPAAPSLGARLPRMFSGWSQLAVAPPQDLGLWQRTHLDELVELAAWTAVEAGVGDTCVHLDVRSDNILVTPTRVVFVDWNWAAIGPDWFDTVCLALEVRAAGGDAEGFLAAHPRTQATDPAPITGVIASLAGMFEERSRAPAPPGLPRLRPFQARYADAVVAWARERTGWR